MIILNLKTYDEASGENLDSKLTAIEQVIMRNPSLQGKVLVAPNLIQLGYVRKEFPNLEVVAQHADNVDQGQSTGMVPLELLVDLQIKYLILNHSEHRLTSAEIRATVQEAGKLDLKCIVCCEAIDEAKTILASEPFAIAYENQDLIGSGVSITSRPETIQDFIALFKDAKKTLPFVGAGVSNSEDIQQAFNLGAEGVLLASAFVKAGDPQSTLTELVSPLFT